MTAESMRKGALENRWCSWCFKRTTHDRVDRNFLRRNVYQCRACLNRTLECRLCKCMARGHAGYDDEQCAKCDGTVDSWEQGPKTPKPSRWCSWCFEQTQHRLVQQNTLRRDVYECEGCGRRTLPCRGCDAAFVRGHPTWDDEKCAKCDGTVVSWSQAKTAKEGVSREAWCSWCFERTTHALEQKNDLRRDVYSCSQCMARTLPCRKCDDGMTRGGPGWDDEKCASCDSDVEGWAAARGRREELAERDAREGRARSHLHRDSEHKRKALEAGVIRPFLLLVSMDTITRNEVAQSLGWSLYTKSYLGDPHAEAWDIIHANAKGLQARTNATFETLNPLASNCNWYETLYRVSMEVFRLCDYEKKSWAKSIDSCRDPGDDTMRDFESWFLGKVSQLQIRHMTEAQVAELDEFMEADEVRELAAAMRRAGISRPEVIRYAVNTVCQALRAGGFNTYVITVKVAAAMNRQLGTKIAMSQATQLVSRVAFALNVIGWVWLAADMAKMAFGPSHGRLFAAVNRIATQRLFLALEDLRIEDFYT